MVELELNYYNTLTGRVSWDVQARPKSWDSTLQGWLDDCVLQSMLRNEPPYLIFFFTHKSTDIF